MVLAACFVWLAQGVAADGGYRTGAILFSWSGELFLLGVLIALVGELFEHKKAMVPLGGAAVFAHVFSYSWLGFLAEKISADPRAFRSDFYHALFSFEAGLIFYALAISIAC